MVVSVQDDGRAYDEGVCGQVVVSGVEGGL
jgi:hypothetical protein